MEDEIFKNKEILEDKLINYGFIKKEDYTLKKELSFNMLAIITVDKALKLRGMIYDLDNECEYITFRNLLVNGSFVSKVREEYENLLKDLAENICKKTYFKSDQANRIVLKVVNTYKDDICFLWDDLPFAGVFRNSLNKKWYALIMSIKRCKLDNKSLEDVDVINVKLNSEDIRLLLDKDGYYPAYHMNKKHWISIVLDDKYDDDKIMEYINISYNFTVNKGRKNYEKK